MENYISHGVSYGKSWKLNKKSSLFWVSDYFTAANIKPGSDIVPLELSKHRHIGHHVPGFL